MSPASPLRRRLLAASLGTAALGLAGKARAAGRSVIDMAGRRVRLPARIERIASAGGSPAVNAFLFLFGQGEHIVTGLPQAFQSPLWRLQQTFAPGIANGPVVSGPPPAWTPNVESLLAIKPDLCFVVSEQAAELIERAGMPAIVLKWEKIDSIAQTIRLLGEIFALPERARDYFAWSDELHRRISQRLGQPASRPRVLYLRYATLSQPIIVPANHLIAEAGGDSVTAGDNPLQLDNFPFSVEQMLKWQPEVMLLAFAGEAAKLRADPRLAGLPAVRDQRIYGVPHGAHIWTHYTPEQPLGVLWLAQLLYPERLRDIDLSAETGQFYQRFFGKRLDNAEIAAIVHRQ